MAESVSLHSNLKKARKERNPTLLSEVYGISVDELLGTKAADSEEEPPKTPRQPESSPSLKSFLSNREHWILILILVLTSHQAIVGFIVSCYILVWTLIKRRNYKFVIILSAICVLYHLNSILILDYSRHSRESV